MSWTKDESSSQWHVFVSYSRTDEHLVRPIVDILRAVGVGTFRDADCIPSGERWRPVIENSLSDAMIVAVFWCWHSAMSEEVQREVDRAIELQKRIVPVLLDSMSMRSDLAELQAVDLRSLISQNHPDSLQAEELYGAPQLFTDIRPETAEQAALELLRSIPKSLQARE